MADNKTPVTRTVQSQKQTSEFVPAKRDASGKIVAETGKPDKGESMAQFRARMKAQQEEKEVYRTPNKKKWGTPAEYQSSGYKRPNQEYEEHEEYKPRKDTIPMKKETPKDSIPNLRKERKPYIEPAGEHKHKTMLGDAIGNIFEKRIGKTDSYAGGADNPMRRNETKEQYAERRKQGRINNATKGKDILGRFHRKK